MSESGNAMDFGPHSIVSISANLCGFCSQDGAEVTCTSCNVSFHRQCVVRFAQEGTTNTTCDECNDKERTEDMNRTLSSSYDPNWHPRTNSTMAEEFEQMKLKCMRMEKEMRRLTRGPQTVSFASPDQGQDQGQNSRQEQRQNQDIDRTGSNDNGARNPAHESTNLTFSFRNNSGNSTMSSWKDHVSHLNETFNLEETITLTKSQRDLRKTIDTTLPQFCGEARQWVRFITTFSSTTTSCGFTDSENRRRLKSALYGDALRLVKDKLEHLGSMDVIIRRLVQAFGQPAHLMKGIRQVVNKMPALDADLGNAASCSQPVVFLYLFGPF